MCTWIDHAVKDYKAWKQKQADKLLSEEIEYLKDSGIFLFGENKEQLKIQYDIWVEYETSRYRYILESEVPIPYDVELPF